MRNRTQAGPAAAALLRFAAVAAIPMACGASPAAADEFYAGRQITFIVGAGVGGGYDLQARVTARYLGNHIPGKPAIVVQNMPARIAAANHMFGTAPKDGTAIALIQRGMLLARLIYPAGTRFEIDKFNWLGSLNSETAVTLAWHTELVPGGLKSWGDLFSEGLKGEIMLFNSYYMSLYTFAAAKASLDGKPGTAASSSSCLSLASSCTTTTRAVCMTSAWSCNGAAPLQAR